MLKLKKIKPIGSQVLVTKNLYGWDDFMEGGVLIHKRGDLKDYQEVLSVGDDVRFVKPGDVVKINLYKYAVFKEDPNSVKAMADNPIVGLRLNEVEMVDVDGEPVMCFLIDQRDVDYILEDYSEETYKAKKLVVVDKPVKKLLLPNNKIEA
jgi:hypothetical protein